jgi:hypothetical protein
MGINTVSMDNGEWAISRTSLCCTSWPNTRQSRWFYTALIIQVSRSPTPPATCCPSPDQVVGDLAVTLFSLMAN